MENFKLPKYFEDNFKNYHFDVLRPKINDNSNYIVYGKNENNSEQIQFIVSDISQKKKTEDYKQVLKILLIRIALKNYSYFPNIEIELFNDKQNIIYIIKENIVQLKYLILSKCTSNLEDKSLIKWIIYQITYGLYVLHSNNIIHNNIKTSNIYINESGGIFINGLDSATFKGEKVVQVSYSYSSPEFLIFSEVDEKSDMWSLGIIMLELFCKKYLLMGNEKLNNRNDSIKYILKFFGIEKDYSFEELKMILHKNENIQFTLDKSILEKIADKEAINFISNLLVFNPNQRYSAKQALESDYLAPFINLDPIEVKKLQYQIDYKEISKVPVINEETFIELVKKIIGK